MAGGNPSHLTKAEISARKKSEIKTGDNSLECPGYLKKDFEALEKWKEILIVYKDVDFVSSGDVGLLARYCMTHSEYIDLLNRRLRIDDISNDCDDAENYIKNQEDFNYILKNKILDAMSTSAVLGIDTAINKKMDMLIKMEDRLFLNPLAKIKNVPKEVKEEEVVNKFSKYQKGSG